MTKSDTSKYPITVPGDEVVRICPCDECQATLKKLIDAYNNKNQTNNIDKTTERGIFSDIDLSVEAAPMELNLRWVINPLSNANKKDACRNKGDRDGGISIQNPGTIQDKNSGTNDDECLIPIINFHAPKWVVYIRHIVMCILKR
ncbi:hypothetical protein [Providencia heimbachae]|uniref:hypothetical protein n=1 Tax=Providencia heimbachae TaxID=333962 RepID=UPI00224002F8|nr:hypothetical protein [Providencia heimbachae]